MLTIEFGFLFTMEKNLDKTRQKHNVFDVNICFIYYNFSYILPDNNITHKTGQCISYLTLTTNLLHTLVFIRSDKIL